MENTDRLGAGAGGKMQVTRVGLQGRGCSGAPA
jgi:hypothetical protein